MVAAETIPRPVADELRLREELLARVDSIRGVLSASAEESEQLRTLAPKAVEALLGAGLLGMKVPAAVGGLEASLSTQMLVIAELARIDSAVGWTAMVNSNSAGFMGAYLPDEGLQDVFAEGRIPICAGVAPPAGFATTVDDGYLVSGRWRFCSGINHAEWLRLTTFVSGDPSQPIFAVVPKGAVTVHDNWHVLGLKGTGSSDFSLEGCFIPIERTLPGPPGRRRGGPLYRLTDLRWSSFEHTGIALGLGTRALEELIAVLRARSAGAGAAPREVVLDAVGRLAVALDAGRSLAVEVFDRDLELLADPSVDQATVGIEGRALATHITQVALECARTAFRYVGASSLYQPNVFERLLRDLEGASQHVLVKDESYAGYGATLLGASS